MSEARPVWRQAYDMLEQAVGPQLKTVVSSEPFAVAVGLMARAQKSAQRQAERNTRRLLHLWNLPAGSDVTRIIAEIGKLQREVRELTRQVDGLKDAKTKDPRHDESKEVEGGRTGGNGRSPGSRQARR